NTFKERWSNIRDQYRKTLNKQKISSSQASKKWLKYKYEDRVNFLKQYFQERPTISSIESSFSEEDNTYEVPDTNVSADNIINNSDPGQSFNAICMSTPTKRRIQFDSKNRKSSENTSQKDLIDTFLMDIGATMKTFDPFHANLVKTKIFTAVQEVGKQQIIHNQRLIYDQPS
ncbi:transcription factor Adf-1-like, partial [Aphis craccivora]